MKISASFLEKYNIAGPRYTSYPPANVFHSGFGINEYKNSLDKSNTEQPANISIYVHIPFCVQRCYFCGCNTTLYENELKTEQYIKCIIKEIIETKKHIDDHRYVTQIHFGGGTPNAIDLSHLGNIIKTINNNFKISENCETAIECNPAYLNKDDIDALAAIGFNRLSLGIQDFNNEVLKAVNRKEPQMPVNVLINHVKSKGFKGTNIDLVYGLPLQTLENFKYSIEQAIKLAPDRIVCFSYAHVPWFNSEQKKLEKFKFPAPEEKLEMLSTAINTLDEAGYIAIGMDHFAKPDDELAIAKTTKTLHRNFQGYCTKEKTGQVYAFGASAISQFESAYAQNIKDVAQYIIRIENEGLATERGYHLSKNEQIIRDVINQLMCNGQLDFGIISKNGKKSIEEIKNILSFKEEKLSTFIRDGLLSIEGNTININNNGMMVVRNIAMAFDPALNTEGTKYSKTV